MDGDSAKVALAITTVMRRDGKFDSLQRFDLALSFVVRMDISGVWQVVDGVDFGFAQVVLRRVLDEVSGVLLLAKPLRA